MLKSNPAIEAKPLQTNSNHHDSDDIDLPLVREMDGGMSPSNHPAEDSKGWGKLLASASLMAFLLICGGTLLPSDSNESQHPNWQHVSAATDASSDAMSQFVRISKGGSTETRPSLEVTAADANRAATWRVRQALLRNDLAAATTALQSAQRIPIIPDADIQLPVLAADADLIAALKGGRKELFQMELFDCCQEDGDVVEVVVNGSYFATVPIMHAGTLLSIPLASGNNTITVRGARDGGGGVTLSFHTSRGDFIARHLRVGEAYQMAVTVR